MACRAALVSFAMSGYSWGAIADGWDVPQVRVVQMRPDADKAANLGRLRAVLATAAPQPGELLVLPEMWSCLGGDRAAKWAAAEPLPQPGAAGGEVYETLRGIARRHAAWVHGGSIAERDGSRLYNTSVVFGADGTEVARYRKIHLFDVTTPDGAGYRESSMFGAGDRIVCFDWHGMRVGCAICYDLRFPELFARLRLAGAQLLVLPAAFTQPTGLAHWHVLLRARAIETQCWVAAAATCGVHQDAAGQARTTYGHSLVCDPWGQVMVELGEQEATAAAVIDLDRVARVRADMPVLEHRRLF